MNVFFFLLLLVPISLRTCAAWGPLHQTSIGRQHFWSRHNAPRFSRCHILRAEQRIVAADDKAKSKPLIALPKQTTLIPTGRKIDIIRNEEDELLSPELLGAGAIAGLIAIAATLSAAKSFEWR